MKGDFIMPRGDGTGPMRMGPMTGRGAGYCAGYAVPGYANPAGFAGGFAGGRGFGRGFGRGMGRGFGRMYRNAGMPGRVPYAAPVYAEANAPAFHEKAFLSNQVETLEAQLKQLKERLSALDEKTE